MEASIKKWMERVSVAFTALSTPKKIAVVAVVGVLVAAGVALSTMRTFDNMQVLYSDLTREDMQAVTKKLAELGVAHQIAQDQNSVLVPQHSVDSARMELAKEGLPGHDVVGFEKFDGSTFGMSNYVQRIQYMRAVQGELVRSIQQLHSVKKARVHITMPPKKSFLEDVEPPKASVVVELKRGESLSKQETKGIAHLVASAVEGLKVEQVSILDTHGQFLHQPEQDLSTQSSQLLEHQRALEESYEKRIVELLTPVLGVGKVFAKVTAELDLSRINVMEEKYDADNAVLSRTVRNSESNSGTRPTPSGVPGSRSNLPGAESATQNPSAASSVSEKDTQDSSYAIPKTVQTTTKPSGSIRRLTVAVIVDGIYKNEKGEVIEPGTGKFEPRPDSELNRFQDIVANAVGFDPSRQDKITINSLPVGHGEIIDPQDEKSYFLSKEFIQPLVKNSLILLAILMFFFGAVRPFLKWLTLHDVEKEIAIMPKTVAELQSAQKDDNILSLSKAISTFDLNEPIEKQENKELVKKVFEKIDQSPKKSAQILQEWIEVNQAHSKS